jgi:hypothetical protein
MLLGKIHIAQAKAEYASPQMGLGTSMVKSQCVDYKVCGDSLAAESL